ncbi:MAG TPA: molybdopterin synthase catalytic subunit MoaE [Burkholderiaceae bacterium]|jgi:molybdopterin synthase catalytic subunit|nr:molybdopterin synthase catalytic subunit MoaE [Burkholderiaceae bacterium]
MTVRVQLEDFDAGDEIARLRAGNARVGGVVSFIGTVRDLNEGQGVSTLTLEHYPGMTERSLDAICDQARARWNLEDLVVIHRHGELRPMDQIVLVAVASAHRGEAFEACEFIMDYLKTQAPFWKKETTAQGERWVQARDTDDEAARRWSA